jgi:type IV pilus biogenesis protein CpaD/CtpE
MNSVKFPAVTAKLLATSVISILCVSLSGCVSDDMSDVSTLKPFGGSKQHPIVIKGGKASVADCGDWSENLAQTEQNTFAPNHGCAVQSNIAALAAYPEDLAGGKRPVPPTDGWIAVSAITNLSKPAN